MSDRTGWSYVIEDEDYMGGTVVKVCPSKMMSPVAQLAADLAEKWGMVAAVQDGEDSAGRSKLRRLTPEEVAQHACNTAECLHSEFERRGWIFDIPAPKPRKKDHQEA